MPSKKRPAVSLPLLPLKNDFVFKLVFGDKRRVDLLTPFLQAVLDLPAKEYSKVIIVDPNVKKEYRADKAGVLDVKIHTKTGNVIDVEIQVEPEAPLRKRISFYQAKMLIEQIGEGDDYDVIKKVISIIITDYKLIKNSPAYHHRFRLYDPINKVELTDIQEINVLELPKLPKKSDATDLFDWMSLIGAKKEEEYEMLAQKKPVFGKVVAVVKQLSADEEARMEYDKHELWRMDYSATMKNAARKGHARGLAKGHAQGLTQGLAEGREQGLTQGLEQGLEQGLAEGKGERSLEIARNMKALGLATAVIAKSTGLSAKQIEQLK